LVFFEVFLAIHPYFNATVTLNIARTEDEAKEQAKLGRALIASETEEVQAAAADAAKEELLDDEALKAEKAAAAAEAAEAEAPAEEATEEAAQA
ncbi:MAG: 50S ribosomal protein L9, partial [Pseudomonadota bacterium]|nr:50S ribosomal protein L9 [Pseudomonadota bacterium]